MVVLCDLQTPASKVRKSMVNFVYESHWVFPTMEMKLRITEMIYTLGIRKPETEEELFGTGGSIGEPGT
jgi:hypothetical protein